MESTFRTQCPHCAVKLKLASRPAHDKTMKCPSCQKAFVGADLKLTDASRPPSGSSGRASEKQSSSASDAGSGKAPKATSKVSQPKKPEPVDETFDESFDPESHYEDSFSGTENETDFESDLADDWDDQDFEEPAALPPRKKSVARAVSASSKEPASTKQPRPTPGKSNARKIILISSGSLLALALIGGVVLSFTSKSETSADAGASRAQSNTPSSEYEQLYAEWLNVLKEAPPAGLSERSAEELHGEATRVIKEIQATIDPAGQLNYMLPEDLRKPVAELSASPAGEGSNARERDMAIAEFMKKDVRELRKTSMEFGVKPKPWTQKLSDALDAQTLTPIQEKLYKALMVIELLEELA